MLSPTPLTRPESPTRSGPVRRHSSPPAIPASATTKHITNHGCGHQTKAHFASWHSTPSTSRWPLASRFNLFTTPAVRTHSLGNCPTCTRRLRDELRNAPIRQMQIRDNALRASWKEGRRDPAPPEKGTEASIRALVRGDGELMELVQIQSESVRRGGSTERPWLQHEITMEGERLRLDPWELQIEMGVRAQNMLDAVSASVSSATEILPTPSTPTISALLERTEYDTELRSVRYGDREDEVVVRRGRSSREADWELAGERWEIGSPALLDDRGVHEESSRMIFWPDKRDGIVWPMVNAEDVPLPPSPAMPLSTLQVSEEDHLSPSSSSSPSPTQPPLPTVSPVAATILEDELAAQELACIENELESETLPPWYTGKRWSSMSSGSSTDAIDREEADRREEFSNDTPGGEGDRQEDNDPQSPIERPPSRRDTHPLSHPTSPHLPPHSPTSAAGLASLRRIYAYFCLPPSFPLSRLPALLESPKFSRGFCAHATSHQIHFPPRYTVVQRSTEAGGNRCDWVPRDVPFVVRSLVDRDFMLEIGRLVVGLEWTASLWGDDDDDDGDGEEGEGEEVVEEEEEEEEESLQLVSER